MKSETANSGAATLEDQLDSVTRIVSLERSEAVISLGFSIRGGIEHGLGHFVSSVEPESEASRNGLRAGDEVLAVCGLPIHGATHKEVVNFISSRWKLELEIRSVGAIPVKNRKGDPISWVPTHQALSNKSQQKSRRESGTENKRQNEILTVQVASPNGKRSLGCSIFKGRRPEDTGIYVQAAKQGGLARRAGLRPGDQILECNGVSFENIDLAEAVVHLKSGKELDLLIRKGSHDLLHGESSGYDSSSGASASGGGSHSKGEHSEKAKSKPRVAFDPDEVKKDERKIQEETKSRLETIGRLAEERKLLESQMDLERRRLEREQEALKKEAEKLEAEKKKFEEEKRKQMLIKTNSTGSLASSREGGDSSGSEGLASALQMEIERRRRQAATDGNDKTSTPKALTPKSSTNGSKSVSRSDARPFKALPAGMLKNDQHDQLMEEFRRVHRKMFSAPSTTSTDESENEKEKEKEQERTELKASENTEGEEKEKMQQTSVKVETKEIPTVFPPKIPAEKRQQQFEAKSPPKCPPPPPPARSSSMTPPESCSSSPCPPPPQAPTMTFKSDSYPANKSCKSELYRVNSSPSYLDETADPVVESPGIPTPDYDSSPRSSPISSRRTASDERPSARNSPPASPLSTSSVTLSSSSSSSSSGSSHYLGPRRSSLVKNNNNNIQRLPAKNHWNMTTFSKRHPLMEIGSLESFNLDENGLVCRRAFTDGPAKPPDFYFEPPKSQILLLSNMESQGPDPTELLLEENGCFQFEFLPRQTHNRSVRFDEGSAAVIASHDYRIAHASGKSDGRHLETQLLHTLKKSGIKWESNPALSTSSGLSSEDDLPPKRPLKSPKKHAAPPPPPPPPAVMMAKPESLMTPGFALQ